MCDTKNCNDLIYNGDSSRRLNDLFKGVAIFCILLTHSHQLFNVPSLLFDVLNVLQVGCQIFFVLSAFGLCLSFDKKRTSWLSFMKHRISKIAIVYWIMILYYMVYEIIKALIIGEGFFSRINFPGVIVNFFFLNGLVPIDFINNHIVSGGWFIGTLVLLYALFPLLFSIYNIKNADWRRIRALVFPLATFVVSFIVINVAGYFNPDLSASNPFIYRSFVNQLPCFAVGFSLYDLYKNRNFNSVKYTSLFFVLFAAAGTVLFYIERSWTYSVFPFLFSVAFLFLYISIGSLNSLSRKLVAGKNILIVFFERLGKISLYVYMVQSIVCFYLADYIIRFLKLFCGNELFLYIILLPFLIFMSVFLGWLLCKADRFVRRNVKGIVKNGKI